MTAPHRAFLIPLARALRRCHAKTTCKETAENLGDECWVARHLEAQIFRKRHEMRSSVVHAARIARRAQATRHARECHEAIETACVAMYANKSMAKQAAFEVSFEGVFDESGKAESVLAAFDRLGEHIRQESLHYLVEHTSLRFSTLILSVNWCECGPRAVLVVVRLAAAAVDIRRQKCTAHAIIRIT